MGHRLTTTTILGVLFFVPAASAQMYDPAAVFVSGRISVGSSSLLSVGERVRNANQPEIDYAVFTRELVAFIAKEIFPDAGDEYAHSSEIPSQLTYGPDLDFRLPPSRFGAHCLIVLRQMGSTLSPLAGGSYGSFAQASPTLVTYLVRAGATALALEQVWSALREGSSGEGRSRLSLDPKVGTNKVGAYLTVRW